MEIKEQASYALKTEFVKNRTIRKYLNISHTSTTPKNLKNQDHVENLCINLV